MICALFRKLDKTVVWKRDVRIRTPVAVEGMQMPHPSGKKFATWPIPAAKLANNGGRSGIPIPARPISSQCDRAESEPMTPRNEKDVAA
jgi:hypothetical protein